MLGPPVRDASARMTPLLCRAPNSACCDAAKPPQVHLEMFWYIPSQLQQRRVALADAPPTSSGASARDELASPVHRLRPNGVTSTDLV